MNEAEPDASLSNIKIKNGNPADESDKKSS